MYHVIINPASRSGKGLRIWNNEVEPALRKAGVPYRFYLSGQAGDTTRFMRDLCLREKEDMFVIVLGGDGTVNEALQGMDDSRRVTLGYIPTGSSNDLARDLGIPKKPLEALDVILRSGRPSPMDLGTVVYPDGEKRRFAVSCGIGFDAAVCEEALSSPIKDALNRLRLGKLTYLCIALKQLFAAKAISCEITLDGRRSIFVPRLLFSAFMNHPYEGGGFCFCPQTDNSDGLLDLCVVGDLPKLFILFALPTAFFGKHYIFPKIDHYTASSVRVKTSAPLWVHTDGEVYVKSDQISISCLKQRIRFLV